MEKLTKTTLIEDLMSSEKDMTRAMADRTVNLIFNRIVETVAAGQTATITGFGTFSSAQSPERKGHNPSTHEEITIPAKTRIKFKAGKLFKEAIGG